jgi:hypothetical protein
VTKLENLVENLATLAKAKEPATKILQCGRLLLRKKMTFRCKSKLLIANNKLKTARKE